MIAAAMLQQQQQQLEKQFSLAAENPLGRFAAAPLRRERTKAGRWKCFIYFASNQTDGLARSLPSGFSRTFYFQMNELEKMLAK